MSRGLVWLAIGPAFVLLLAAARSATLVGALLFHGRRELAAARAGAARRLREGYRARYTVWGASSVAALLALAAAFLRSGLAAPLGVACLLALLGALGEAAGVAADVLGRAVSVRSGDGGGGGGGDAGAESWRRARAGYALLAASALVPLYGWACFGLMVVTALGALSTQVAARRRGGPEA